LRCEWWLSWALLYTEVRRLVKMGCMKRDKAMPPDVRRQEGLSDVCSGTFDLNRSPSESRLVSLSSSSIFTRVTMESAISLSEFAAQDCFRFVICLRPDAEAAI
jgi:hypothetical protein